MADVMDATNQERAKRVAVERIVGFAKQFGEVHLNLACHAAFPLVLTPDLLYQIWAHFVPEAPWSGVARVLLSRLCRQVGYEMYEMDIAVRNLLLREIKEQFGQERLDELAEFLMDYVAQQLTEDDVDTQDLREAQEWTALAYTKPDEAARELALALSERVKQEDMGEVLRLTSWVETLAEPLMEGGFEPLLIYSRGMRCFVRGDVENAKAELTQLPNQEAQIKIATVNLPIPERISEELKVIWEENRELQYQNFLLQALQIILKNPDDIQAFYSFLSSNINYLDREFIYFLKEEWIEAISKKLEIKQFFIIASSINQFSFLIQYFSLANKADNLEIAIGGYLLALSLLNRETFPEEWGKVQDRIGKAFINRIYGERAENIERAIVYYSHALEVYTCDTFPQDWAAVQKNLGEAYFNRLLGERAENIEKAISFYQAALQVYTPAAFPQDWAATQKNLGEAYFNRLRGERAENIEKAIAFYKAALQVYTPVSFPQNWAMLLSNLGNAYQSLGECQEAIRFYQQSLEIARLIDNLHLEAIAFGNLGSAYQSVGQYREAIRFHERHLEMARFMADKKGEAISLNNLGNAYQSLGQHEEAISFYQQSLEIARLILDKRDEANFLGNLGTAYYSLGDYKRAIDLLEESLNISREIGDRQSVATSLSILGNIYNSLGEYEQAIHYHQQSLNISREISEL